MTNAQTEARAIAERFIEPEYEQGRKALERAIATALAAKDKELAAVTTERDDLAIRAATIDEALTNAIHMRQHAEAQLAETNAHRQKVLSENERLLNTLIVRDRQLAEANKARVFTYEHQPTDNVDAWQIGEACAKAASDPKCGDYIDRGLILLRELQEKGWGVIRAARRAREAQKG